jgi:sulfatase modifying factor 1
MVRALAIAIVLVAVATAVGLAVVLRGKDEGARCGAGFAVRDARCVVPVGACPTPLQATAHGCDAPDIRVRLPATTIAVGSADWEAEGVVGAPAIQVQEFRIDAFEVTRGGWTGSRDTFGDASKERRVDQDIDAARAASGMTRTEAAAFCTSRGGRLPTEGEWIVAAASAVNPPRRYPWGDTGAVCRRGAWGLSSGPCALAGDGPDTVGAHPDGDSPLGIHDLAGNVAEWVAPDASRPDLGIAKGGSWKSALAADLRLWARLELQPTARDPRVGVRCAYPP